jgi:hypothetical protein
MQYRIQFASPVVLGVLTLAACGGKLDVGGSGGSAGTSPTYAGTSGQQHTAGAGGSLATAGTGGSGHAGANDAGATHAGGSQSTAGTAGITAGHGGSAGSASASGGSAGELNGNGGEGANEGSAGDASGGEGANPGECDCATGEALTLVDCGGGRQFLGVEVYVSDDGSKIVYAPADDAHQVGNDLGTWTAAEGAVISSGYPLGLSGDGRVLLYGVGSDSLVRIDNEIIPVAAALRQLSHDGKVAAGVVETAGTSQAVTWTREGGVVATGVEGEYVIVATISADGSTIGGRVMNGIATGPQVLRAFVWSESTGPVFVGEPAADGSPAADAVTSISPNGLYAAGTVRSAELEYRVFRYSSSGLVDIGPCYSSAADCALSPDSGLSFSDDGSILAGTYGNQHGPTTGHAFVHTQATGVTPLAIGELTTVRGISSDGSLVLGVLLDGDVGIGTPFVWDQVAGLRRLPDILSAADVDTRGWTFKNASKLSKDGRVIVGEGTCGGASALFRVVLEE